MSSSNHDPIPSSLHSNGPLLTDEDEFSFVPQQFRFLQYQSWKFSLQPPNCYVVIADSANSKVQVTIENIVVDDAGSVFFYWIPFSQ